MLDAEKANVDAAYWPVAVIPLARVVPLSSDCSWVTKASYVLKDSTAEEAACPIENTMAAALPVAMVGLEDSPARLVVCDPT